MKNTQSNIIGAIAVIALLGVCILFASSPKVTNTFGAIPSVNAPVGGTVLPNGIVVPNPSNFDYLVARLYFYVDGAIGYGNGTSVPTNVQAVRSTLTAATTTPCSTLNPFNATTTVVSSMNITTGTSSAGSLIPAVARGANSTTTVIGSAQPVAAGTQTTLFTNGVASSTGTAVVAGPNQYVNWGTTVGSGVAYGYTYGGTCTTIFTTVN